MIGPRDRTAVERELREVFAAAGEPLTAAVLKSEAHGSWRLELDAWRGYWRQLLLTALAAPWDDYEARFLDRVPELELVHTSVYVLRPNPCGVLQGGGASEVIVTRGRLTHLERVAIARYLHAVLEFPAFARHNLAQLAAQAILWCWKDDPDAVAAAEAYRRRVRSYQRPPAEDPRDEALAVQIETAFADTPPPTGPLMTSTWEEASEYALELAGSTWQSLQPWFVNINHAAFSFMTPAAFRYFLPAALRHKVVHGSSVDPEFFLVDAVMTPSSYQAGARAKVDAFAPGERAVLGAYLASIARYTSDPALTERAIRELYTAPSITSVAPLT